MELRGWSLQQWSKSLISNILYLRDTLSPYRFLLAVFVASHPWAVPFLKTALIRVDQMPNVCNLSVAFSMAAEKKGYISCGIEAAASHVGN